MISTRVVYGLLLCGLLHVLSAESKSHISVVLVGATGDLAKKYLWQGLFQSYSKQVGGTHSLSFYGGTRLSSSEASPVMYEILKGLSCLPNVPSVKCALLKDQFLKLTQYHRLDTHQDYSALNKKIKEVLDQEGLREEGRLFYLSVPAFAYADIATKINATCRPQEGSWLRVVLEKPFGHDLHSAQQLAEELRKVLREEEMYRIDHYLGKQAIAHILPFRHDNQHSLNPIWNQHHIERVEIVMKETVDSKGVAIFLDNPQWDNVPFLLTAGKALDERVGYTRILFKTKAFCLQNESTRKAEFSQCRQRQIIFYVGHGDLNFPAILVSKNLFKPVMDTSSWKQVTEFPDVQMFGIPLSDYYIYTPVMQKDAYAVLIPQIFQAKRDCFVNTEDLLASWKVWTPLLKEFSNVSPRLYPGGARNGDILDFKVEGKTVSFTRSDPVAIISESPSHQTVSEYKAIASTFRGNTLVSAVTEDLIAKLASYLQQTAQNAVQERGNFHLAVSGGSSPKDLFRRLAAHHYTFPWKRTHFWMVDERCVPLDDPKSNFRSLHDNLLKDLKVPYVNIHPMPVHMNQRLCVEDDRGAGLYANEIEMLVNGTSFDFVLLGVGADGHIASLFPNSQALTLERNLVLFTESPVKPHQRMTLSLRTINKAKHVAVLITGRSKHPIVGSLSKEGEKSEKWPITMVQPSGGELVWFIDHDALFG
ncbi:hypothetical protein chiPu_0015376 [Chiloscyllium punctatum]|uniref:GDH/6PGL endoplasmic bifunctional protein n=1 Tax=Chiloscyllium punctatum TaxID=137246 RepID=A0A401T2I5_CHIPU|nr:hypothetical protein [Chiloscyllium punctatum]